MLSARDIQNKSFSRARSGGYSIEEVDEFLDEVVSTVVNLTEEKNVLSTKALNLSEKLETVRDEQELWKKSIITTQKSYDEVIEAAKKQAADIIRAAQVEAEQKRSAYAKEAAETEAEINDLKVKKNELNAEIEAFKKTLLSAYEKHIALIRELPVMKHETVAATKVTEVKEPEGEKPVKPVTPAFEEPKEKTTEELKEDLSSTIVLPKNIFKHDAAEDKKLDDEIAAEVDDFISRIDTSRVSFDKDDVVDEEPEEEEEKEEKKVTLFDDDFPKKKSSFFSEDDNKPSRDDDEEDEEDDDEEDEERESVLKNLFSGGFSSRNKEKDKKKKKSRFFVDDDEDDDDVFDDDEE